MSFFFFFNDTATTEIYTLSLHDALPICIQMESGKVGRMVRGLAATYAVPFELGELNLGPDATETAARRARHAWLAGVQRRPAARYLVTPHHADDQGETILLRGLKGSRPPGIAGKP